MTARPQTLLIGDMRVLLKDVPPNSLDSCVTDPPYNLTSESRRTPGAIGSRGFMGRSWDGGGVAFEPETWRAVYDVLKPGAHLLAFTSSRTYHRIACAIEDAGFIIGDSIFSWLYSSGFPHSRNIAADLDRAGGINPAESARRLRQWREDTGLTRSELAELVGCTEASVRDWEEGRRRSTDAELEWIVPSPKYREALDRLCGYGTDRRTVIGAATDRRSDGTVMGLGHTGVIYGDALTDLAQEWKGWGSALKPAVEPIVVGIKPRDGTIVNNILTWGTGGMNIDGCRVKRGENDRYEYGVDGDEASAPTDGIYGDYDRVAYEPHDAGRWPTNVVFTHAPGCKPIGERTVPSATHYPSSRGVGGIGVPGHAGQEGLDEVSVRSETMTAYECVPGCPVALLDAQSGVTRSAATKTPVEHGDPSNWVTGGFGGGRSTPENQYRDEGGASRYYPTFEWGPADGDDGTPGFFYVAKADDHERPQYINEDNEEVEHTTVKPLALMRWLVRLVTPPGGVTLDPFGGSGTTAEAAILEGFGFVMCELGATHEPLIQQRIDRANNGLSPVPEHANNRRWEQRKTAAEASGQSSLFDL